MLRTNADFMNNPRPDDAIGYPRLYRPLAPGRSYPAATLRLLLMDLHGPINAHVLLFLAFEPPADREALKAALVALLGEIAVMRIRGKNTPIPEKLYRDFLWKGPFEGHAIETIDAYLADLRNARPGLERNAKDLAELARELEAWHATAASLVESEDDVDRLIASL